ncbi:MAG: hypothetical protein HC923_10245 [Myxococcales bacterium]|nr:hypothetical protein [Myxococcales bacterium]
MSGDVSLDALGALEGLSPEGREASRDLGTIFELASRTDAGSHLVFSPTLARGLGYYTGAIYEVAVPELSGSLGGGGRYDGLVGMFSGKEVPACGFSLGLERILVVLAERASAEPHESGRGLLVGFSDEGLEQRAHQLASTIRGAGHRVELWPKADKPGRLRKLADDRGFTQAILLRADRPNEVNFWSRREPERSDRFVSDQVLLQTLDSP